MRVRESGRGAFPALFIAVILALGPGATFALAVVTEIVGSSRARVVKFGPNIPTETDSSQISVPTTVPNPPAVARAQLEQVAPGGDVTAGGESLAVFEPPNFTGIGVPNDVGIDIGCFTDDNETTWLVEAGVTERRTIILDSTQTGTNIVPGSTERAQSRIVLSGVMLITSLDPLRDLSGVEVNLNVDITKYDEAATPTSQALVEGAITLRGGPLGAVTVAEATGVFAPIAPTVLDFSPLVINLPLVKAIIFAGVEIPYEYEFTPNREFDLELVVSAQVENIPGGTGGAAVFGLPQTSLNEVFAKVRQDDTGTQVDAAVTQHVDTTGAIYQGFGIPFLAPFCGVFGIEGAFGALAIGGAIRLRRRRRRSRSRC